MITRKGLMKFRNRDVTVIGPDLKPGDKAPEFTGLSQEWEPVKLLKSTKGKVRIITAVLSLDTSVCDRETRRFNQEAAALGKDVVIITISTDTPYTQKRWCGATGVDQVMVISDHPNGDFGKKYGTLLKEVGILRRSVFIVDQKGLITYSAYMPALGIEPDYEEVLKEARKALSGQ